MLFWHWAIRAGLAGRLYRRQQQRNQNADNRDDNQQFDERKTGAVQGPVVLKHNLLPGAFHAPDLVAFGIDLQSVHAVAQSAMGLGIDRIIDGTDRAVAQRHVQTVCVRAAESEQYVVMLC